ncbi:MAG: MlrC C-terminal domain-containing protein [Candidatus Hydrogenedentes bacterium]|nr:MlrC C-terminal domain-containing protein [Candidatus Hydrogenedentota bacterium]
MSRQGSLRAGGKTDHRHGRSIPLEGRVLCISDGRFTEHEARHGGMRDNQQGLTAVVETSQEHTIVLNSLRIMPTSLQQLLSLGIAPAEKKVIIVKGVTAPRAAYEPIAAAVIPVDSSGITQAGPESFHYSQRPRPLFPREQTEYWLPVCT